MSLNSRLQPTAARSLGPQFADNPNRMAGQDGAYSIPLDDGALWFFGDTLIGERPVDERMPHDTLREYDGFERLPANCGLVLDDESGQGGLRNFEYVTDGQNEIRPLIEIRPDERSDTVRPWCLDGCYVDGTVYLFYVVVEVGGDVDEDFESGFEIVGSGVARGAPTDLEFTRIERDGSTIFWEKADDRRDPHFGSAVRVDPHSDYVYVYGAETTEAGYDDCYVARVDEESVGTPASYEYYDGEGGWSTVLDDARPVFYGMPNEMSVSYNEHLESYLAVYSLDQTGHVVGRTAPNPWGPWEAPVILWTVDPAHERLASHVPTYAGKEHPELAVDGGRTIYITYVEFSEYFPHLVEVELA